MILWSDPFYCKNHRFCPVILAFSPTDCFQTGACLFGNAFALQLETTANRGYHSNLLKWLTHTLKSIQLVFHWKNCWLANFIHWISTFSYQRKDSSVHFLFFTDVFEGKAASYLLALSFLCPFYWLPLDIHDRGFRGLGCCTILQMNTFKPTWEGRSPQDTAHRPAQKCVIWAEPHGCVGSSG